MKNQHTFQLSEQFPTRFSCYATRNIQNNKFTGWIPNKLKSIHNLKWVQFCIFAALFFGFSRFYAFLNLSDGYRFIRVGGNSWSSRPAPPGMAKAADNNDTSSSAVEKGKQNSGLKGAVIAVIVISVLVVALILMALVKRRSSGSSHHIDEQLIQNRSFTPLVGNDFTGSFFHHINYLEFSYCICRTSVLMWVLIVVIGSMCLCISDS